MRYLQFLIRTDVPVLSYLIKAFFVTLAGEVIVILFLVVMFAAPEDASSDPSPGLTAVILLIFWPVVSTAMIAAIASGTKRIAPTYWHAAALSAIVFTVLFGILLAPGIGAFYAWPYFIYTVVFLAWQLESNLHAWGLTAVLQSAINLIPVLLLM